MPHQFGNQLDVVDEALSVVSFGYRLVGVDSPNFTRYVVAIPQGYPDRPFEMFPPSRPRLEQANQAHDFSLSDIVKPPDIVQSFQKREKAGYNGKGSRPLQFN